jgi:hypothetical protein
MIQSVYRVEMKVRDKILGGIPKNTELLVPWLMGRGNPKPVAEEIAAQVAKEADVSAEAEKAWTTFKGNEKEGYYIEGRQVKAMLKDATRYSQLTSQIPGLTSKVAHDITIDPDRIVLTVPTGEEGKHELTGSEEKAIHVMTPQGPRTSIKISDYVTEPTLKFDILAGSTELTEMVLVRLLAHCEVFEGWARPCRRATESST